MSLLYLFVSVCMQAAIEFVAKGDEKVQLKWNKNDKYSCILY